MNAYLLIAAIFSLFAVIGHFTIGRKQFLLPILKSDADLIPKKIMHGLFHYMSIYMILTTFILFNTSMDQCVVFENNPLVIKFIGISYLGFALVQLIIAATSKIPGGIFKLFQWVFWILIGVFALLGI